MRNNEGRTQIPPELLDQFMKQQEEKFMASQPPQAPMPQASPTGYQIPTDFVELPSQGLFYPQSHPWHNKEKVEVRFMTTREEDILSSQAYAQAGVMFDKLIESVTVDRVSSTSLLPGDRNAILINARKNSYGEEYEFVTNCQNCLKELECSVNLGELGFVEVDVNKITENNTVSVELPVSKKQVEFKIMTAAEINDATKAVEKQAKLGIETNETFELHRRMIVSIDGDRQLSTIVSFSQNMLLKDSRFLKSQYSKFSPDVDFTYEQECESCGHKNKGGVPVGANFFWSSE
jgi:hypothetical protein